MLARPDSILSGKMLKGGLRLIHYCLLLLYSQRTNKTTFDLDVQSDRREVKQQEAGT